MIKILGSPNRRRKTPRGDGFYVQWSFGTGSKVHFSVEISLGTEEHKSDPRSQACLGAAAQASEDAAQRQPGHRNLKTVRLGCGDGPHGLLMGMALAVFGGTTAWEARLSGPPSW